MTATQLLMHALVFLLTAQAVPTLAQSGVSRPDVEIHCVSFGTGPLLECAVKIQRKSGAPVVGANVVLGAMMPSMPMAHTIKPVDAAPSGTPGEYRGALALEMAGVWAVDVDISGPVREKVSRTFRVQPCSNGSGRCAAEPYRPGDEVVPRRPPSPSTAHKH